MASKNLRELRMSTAMSSLTLNRTRSTLAPSLSESTSRVKKDLDKTDVDKKEGSKDKKEEIKEIKEREFQLSYTAAPKKTLNLINVPAKRDWVSKAEDLIKSDKSKNKESRKVRKKRLWLERKNANGKLIRKNQARFVGDWEYLPDLCLELIFQYLTFEKKMKMEDVCENWSRVLMSNTIWSDFVVNDQSFTKSQYNYAGKFYEEKLDTTSASQALNFLGFKIKKLSFLPKQQLHNVCHFQELIIKWCYYKGSLKNIVTFCYVFPCDFASKHTEMDIFGTGGSILQRLKDLFIQLPGLKKVELMDLQLDVVDCTHVLDELIEVCAERITTLKLVNASRVPMEMLGVSLFVNLKVLIISPHNLGEDLVECLGDMKRLRNIQIVTNKYTEVTVPPVDYRVWKAVRKVNPRLRVHLVTEGRHRNEITFQQKAPVKSIVYDSPYIRASTLSINIAVELYGTDLECYAHKQLPKFKMPKSFHDRPDSAYLYMVRQCPYIHTLIIRERISSSTVLLLAYSGKNLRYFHVRRNAIMLKCEWPKCPDWSLDFWKWLKKNCRTYEDMEREVSQILGFRWYALNDKQFKQTPLELNVPFYYEGFDEADQ